MNVLENPSNTAAASISLETPASGKTDSPQPSSRADAKPAPKNDIKALTALRFFGVFWVVIDHAQGAFGCLAKYCETVALCQAVTFFFVLSGFVLTFRYLELAEPRKILAFYVGRLARLWPIHVLGAVLLILLMPKIFKPSGDLLPIFLTNMALAQSAVPVMKYFYSYNAPSWSSSTLLFLYTAFPALLFLIRRSWLLLLSVTTCGVIGSIALASYLNVPEATPDKVSTLGLLYVSPISRLFDFSLGMCAALVYRKYLRYKNLGLLAGTLLELGAVGVLYYIAANSFKWRWVCIDWAGPHGSYWLQNCGFALIGCLVLVTVFSLEAGLLSRVFRSKVFWFLGEISFCIYVLHTVFLVYGREVLHINDSPLTLAAYMAILLVSATGMYYALEKPCRTWSKNFCKKHIYARKAEKPIEAVSAQ